MAGASRTHGSCVAGAPAYRGPLQDVERDDVQQVLESSGWRIEGEGAAELPGLHPNTLRFRMCKLGIQRPAAAAQRSPSPPTSGRGHA
jgi:transcriptional regulator with GAF, ATPase, and Fis domain